MKYKAYALKCHNCCTRISHIFRNDDQYSPDLQRVLPHGPALCPRPFQSIQGFGHRNTDTSLLYSTIYVLTKS